MAISGEHYQPSLAQLPPLAGATAATLGAFGYLDGLNGIGGAWI